MADAQGKVFYLNNGNLVTFRVEGRGTMIQAAPFLRLAEKFLANGVNQVRVDLRQCKYMDSTFIGTLLSIHKQLAKREAGPLVVLSPSSECGKILQQMGLLGMMPTSQDEAPAGEWSLLDSSTDAPELRRTATEAHEHLAGLPGDVGKQFEAVIRCISGAQQPPPKPE
jgi:anti-anti-sigma factor